MTAVNPDHNSTLKPVPVICGPTASGKTALALRLFPERAVAISADSVQIYRGMDIGSAKPEAAEQAILPHRLIDIRDPDQPYSAGDFFKDAERTIGEIFREDKQPLIAGGTGLYLKALTQGLFDAPPADTTIREELTVAETATPGSLYRQLQTIDPASAAVLSPNDQRRIIRALEVYRLTGTPISVFRAQHNRTSAYTFRIAGIIHDRSVLAKRIAGRVESMISNGLIKETRRLLDAGYPRSLPAMESLGYRHACEHLLDGLDLAEMTDRLIRDTVAFARRQILLFKKIPGLVWFNAMDIDGLQRYFSL